MSTIIPPSRIEMLVGFQGMLREAWDCFRTDRLKEAETAARALITDLELGASRVSTPQPRPQAELMRLRAAARVVLGCVLDRVGQQAEALGLFAEAEGFFAQAEPGDNTTGLDERYRGLALYFLGRGKNSPDLLERALYAFQNAYYRGDTTVETYRHLGLIQQLLKNLDEAQMWTQKALILAPSSPAINQTLAAILEDRGQIKEAAERYERAAQGLMETRRLAEAEAVLRRLHSLRPGDSIALGMRGQVLRALGRREEAVDALRKALMIDPKLSWVYSELRGTSPPRPGP